MKTPLLLVVFTVLGLAASLSAQNTPKVYPISLAPLTSGDALWLTLVREPEPRTGAEINLKLRVIVGGDGTIKVPLLNAVPAAGLTIPDLLQALRGRYAEYFTKLPEGFATTEPPYVSVQFIGKTEKTHQFKIQ